MSLTGRFCDRNEARRRRRCTERTGKVTTATLIVRGGASVAYRYCYRHPQPQTTGIGGTGYPNVQGLVTLYREGEASAPIVDDKITISGVTYQIVQVTAENNADESDGYGVYQLVVT